jgi:hypothetical protein
MEVTGLRKRIIPILVLCQAHKGDLSGFPSWDNSDEASEKLFFAYYSGLFCRILQMMEEPSKLSEAFFRHCELLLDKYNWFNIQREDIELFHSDGPYGCEVPEVLGFLDGVDDVIWKISSFRDDDAICLKMNNGNLMSLADVRGSKPNHDDCDLF